MSVAALQSIADRPSAPIPTLYVGMDIGTFRAAVASLTQLGIQKPDYRREPEPELFGNWSGCSGNGDEYPPTALYYDEDQQGTLPITGHRLKLLLREEKPFTTEGYFRLWKLLFHDKRDPITASIQKVMLTRLEKMGKTAEDILRDWVAVIYEELIGDSSGKLLELRRGTIPSFKDRNIEIVVPVSPGRSTVTHDQVRKAFAQGPITSMQVSLVSEPEAAFQWWVRKVTEKNMSGR